MSRKPKLACPESIADLWGWPECNVPKRPSTQALFLAIAYEARACLRHSNWEDSIRRMENILVVIKARMRRHWEACHEAELERLVNETEKEVNSHVEGKG